EGRDIWTDDASRDPRFQPIVGGIRHQSGAAAPIVLEGEISGAFYLVWWDARRRLAESERATLGAVGQQTGILLRNARRLAETERRRREAEELSQVLRSLTESLDVATVGERTAESIMRIFGAESAVLQLLGPDGSLVTVALAGAAREWLTIGHVMPPGVGLVSRAAREGRACWTADILTDPGLVVTEELRRNVGSRVRAVLAAPVRIKDGTLGVLSISDSRVREFAPTEVALLQSFADQAALAL